MAWLRRTAIDEGRWLVLDVETTGLDAARDRLLAIAAIGVHVDWQARRIALRIADSFEVVIRQEAASPRDNILLHGIGVERQRAGVPLAEALAAFVRFAGTSPLLAFHAAFDRALIERHMRTAGNEALPNRWLDIEHLCGAAHPGVRARSLDEWLAHFHIPCAARHQAIADTLAECELLLRVWPRIAAECGNWRAVERFAAGHRWLPRA